MPVIQGCQSYRDASMYLVMPVCRLSPPGQPSLLTEPASLVDLLPATHTTRVECPTVCPSVDSTSIACWQCHVTVLIYVLCWHSTAVSPFTMLSCVFVNCKVQHDLCWDICSRLLQDAPWPAYTRVTSDNVYQSWFQFASWPHWLLTHRHSCEQMLQSLNHPNDRV